MKLPSNVSGARLQASLRRLGYETVRQRGVPLTPIPTVGAVYDCTIHTIGLDLGTPLGLDFGRS